MKTITICSSRTSDVFVSSVGWYPGFDKVRVSGWYSDSSDACLRFRRAISSESSILFPSDTLPNELIINNVKYIKA